MKENLTLYPTSENPLLLLNEAVKTEAIRLFLAVRDMPFEVTSPRRRLTLEETISNSRVNKRGSCSSKHYLLGQDYQGLSIPIAFITYPFLWQDLKVDYPDQVRKLAEKMPTQYHLVLRIIANGQPAIIDATWDLPLKKAGFLVNEAKEGLEHQLAVIPCGEFVVHASACERWQYCESLKATMKKTGIETEFYQALNLWLESIRQS